MARRPKPIKKVCRGCGETFPCPVALKDKLNHCNDCIMAGKHKEAEPLPEQKAEEPKPRSRKKTVEGGE